MSKSFQHNWRYHSRYHGQFEMNYVMICIYMCIYICIYMHLSYYYEDKHCELPPHGKGVGNWDRSPYYLSMRSYYICGFCHDISLHFNSCLRTLTTMTVARADTSMNKMIFVIVLLACAQNSGQCMQMRFSTINNLSTWIPW